jgi:hypothetical protein
MQTPQIIIPYVVKQIMKTSRPIRFSMEPFFKQLRGYVCTRLILNKDRQRNIVPQNISNLTNIQKLNPIVESQLLLLQQDL